MSNFVPKEVYIDRVLVAARKVIDAWQKEPDVPPLLDLPIHELENSVWNLELHEEYEKKHGSSS